MAFLNITSAEVSLIYRPINDYSTTTIYENRIDPNTLYNITDDTTVNNFANTDLSNVSVPYVISRTSNNYNGVVEIWSDGYCVQTGSGNFVGGNRRDEETTITLTQSYKDINYIAIGAKGNGTAYANSMFALAKTSINTLRISYYDVNANTNNKAPFQYNWRTEGYIS